MSTQHKMKRSGCLVIAGLLSFSLWLFGGFFSETTFAAPVDFPKKEITIIVNMGPGGGRDLIARGVGNSMSQYLGVPVVVMNIPGAGGELGLTKLYHSAPDGYTIGIGMAADILGQILENREYDCRKFNYIGRAESSPGFIFVKSDSPFRSVRDFKAFGKPVRHSTFSFVSISTVAPIIIAVREDFPLVIIGGYKGAVDATMGLIRGESEFSGSGILGIMPFCRSGQIRPLLTFDQKRSPDFPDIPVVGEAGYPDVAIFALDFWFMAPPGVPKARIQILEDALMKTLADPDFLRWAKGAGVNPSPLSGEETTKLVFKFFGLFGQYKKDIEKHIKK